MALGLAVIYVPLLVVVVNSFNADRTFGWPPPGFTTEWWHRAIGNQGATDALITSRAGLGATATRSCSARWRPCRRPVHLLRPMNDLSAGHLADRLPGIVTGIALNNAFKVLGIASACSRWSSGMRPSASWSCTTTCWHGCGNGNVVGVRRASAPGCCRRSLCHLPALRSALLAGAARVRLVLRRGHRDDVHRRTRHQRHCDLDPVEPFRPNQAPIVNAVAAALIVHR